MQKDTPLTKLSLSVACGPVPCDTEEGRSFLQERLSLYGKVCFFLSFGLYLLMNLLNTFLGNMPWNVWITDLKNILHLTIGAIFLAIYLICRAGTRSHLQLALVDLIGVLLVGGILGVNCWALTASGGNDYMAIIGVTNVLLARAVIVPSSAQHTLFAGVVCMTPAVLGIYLGSVAAEAATAPDLHLSPEHSTAILASWGVLALVISTVASRIIYGLQQEVREARQFGQYTLEERIGSGGMGEVYRASHALLRRPTAVKLLRPENAGERSLARFEREVQLTSQLTHPNTVAVYDFGHTPEGTFYYAMEYLDGLNLDQLVVVDGMQPASRVIHILKQVCASLEEAHQIELIHRDIKPGNIIICKRGGIQDVAKVVDFGLVKNIDRQNEATISSVDTITGTPMYLSPEAIVHPGDVDARSDLYAVGAVGYFLLTGQHLFDSDNFMEICSNHLHTVPIRPSARLGKTVPEDIEGLIMMCLEKAPEARPESARALRQALESCKDSGSWTAEDAGAWWEEKADAIKTLMSAVAPKRSAGEVTTAEKPPPTRSIGVTSRPPAAADAPGVTRA